MIFLEFQKIVGMENALTILRLPNITIRSVFTSMKLAGILCAVLSYVVLLNPFMRFVC